MDTNKAKISEAYNLLAELIHSGTEQDALRFIERHTCISAALLIGYGEAISRYATPFPATRLDLYDCCGTGGDQSNTINISTASAIVGASAGMHIAKHGNKGISSPYGSADLITAMGYPRLTPEQTMQGIETTGFGFLPAQQYHPYLKNIMAARKRRGNKTIFNLLGPLTNPARPVGQVLGVYDPAYLTLLAEATYYLGCEHTLVVHGDGLDEISPCGTTQAVELRSGAITRFEIKPEDFGYKPCKKEDLQYESDKREDEILRLLSGKTTGPQRAYLELNAGALLYIGRKGRTLEEGVALAQHLIAAGTPAKTWRTIITFAKHLMHEER